jgi:hypothetical protein
MTKCVICKKIFTKNVFNQITCSKKCGKERKKNKKIQYLKDHPGIAKKWKDIWNKKNKEYIKEYTKLCAIKNKKLLKEWRKNNKKRFELYSQNYYENNKEKYRKYYKTHRKEINLYIKNKRKKNINFKIRCNISGKIRQALKRNSKSLLSMELLGCSIIKLKNHLENQFKPGMNWDNYGYYGWHIDHIKPCCSFDLSKPEEQKKCFHYTNLQPLWAKDNMKKGGKYYGRRKI